jgi:hypothetical protein
VVFKEKIDWNLEDQVDIEAFIEELGDRLDFDDDQKDKIEYDMTYQVRGAYQIIDHIHRATLRTRMTKEQKMLSDRLKQEEREREQMQAELENKQNRRKLGRGAEQSIARRVRRLSE